MFVNHNKLPRKSPSQINVTSVRFNTFVVPQNLGRGRGGHRGDEQGVAHTKLGVCHSVPHVELKRSVRYRRPRIGLVDETLVL
eukprot:77689-Prorocentrum_minimum.AAC.1